MDLELKKDAFKNEYVAAMAFVVFNDCLKAYSSEEFAKKFGEWGGRELAKVTQKA